MAAIKRRAPPGAQVLFENRVRPLRVGYVQDCFQPGFSSSSGTTARIITIEQTIVADGAPRNLVRTCSVDEQLENCHERDTLRFNLRTAMIDMGLFGVFRKFSFPPISAGYETAAFNSESSLGRCACLAPDTLGVCFELLNWKIV